MATTRDGSGSLTLGGVRLFDLARDPAIGTPSYVYDLDAIAAEARLLDAAFDGAPHLVAYAVKANTAGAIVRALVSEGCGADVVSGAEMKVALACGVAPDKVVFSGVAKTDREIDDAIGAGPRGIGAIQAESIEEIVRISARAKALGRVARVSIRINPAVSLDAIDTHAHIATGHDEAKFGVPRADVARAVDVAVAAPQLEIVGLTVHVGSQFLTTDAYVEAARVCFACAREARQKLAGRGALEYVDTGGGFGIDYAGATATPPAEFVRAVRAEQRAAGLDDLALYVEPGRSLVAAHGVLLARVIQTKTFGERRWLMIDAGMNDLIRPALYQALHRIVPLEASRGDLAGWNVVGPVCESSDDFGRHDLAREAPRDVAILDSGAYGYTMASRYNGRQLPVEVFLSGGAVVGRTRRVDVDQWVNERVAAGA